MQNFYRIKFSLNLRQKKHRHIVVMYFNDKKYIQSGDYYMSNDIVMN